MFKYPQFASRKKKERKGRQYFDIGIKIKTIHLHKVLMIVYTLLFMGTKQTWNNSYICALYTKDMS